MSFASSQAKKIPKRFGVKGLLFKRAGPEGGNQLAINEKHGISLAAIRN